MHSIKKFAILLIALIFVLALSSCLGGDGEGSTQKPSESDHTKLPDDNGQINNGNNGNSGNNDNNGNSGNNPPTSTDGLSADGTYYQLTDKNGVVVRIPIGTPLSIGADGSIASNTESVKNDNPYGLTPLSITTSAPTETVDENEEESQNSICIFSAFSKISFGYGNIRHPYTNEFLPDPSGDPYMTIEDYVLVVQCLDEKLNAVEPGDPKAHYIYIYVLDYKTTPGSLMFRETIEYSYSGNKTYYYKLWGNVVFGIPYTEKSISEVYDPSTGEFKNVYSITETIALNLPGMVKVIELKRYYCNPDWSVITWYENVYDDNYDKFLEYNTYDSENRLLSKTTYDEDGYPVDDFNYSYHPNGKLKSLSEPGIYEEYDENGVVIMSSKKTDISPGKYIWNDMKVDELGRVWRSVREYENDIYVKKTEYHADSDVIMRISTDFNEENGAPCFKELYDEQGVLLFSINTEYKGEMRFREYHIGYNFDGSICSEDEIFFGDHDVIIKQIQIEIENGKETYKYVSSNYSDGSCEKFLVYFEGKLIMETDYSEDGTKRNTTCYNDNGDVISKDESIYAEDVLIQGVSYLYDNGKLVEKIVLDNYADGSQKSRMTYGPNGNLLAENHWDEEGKSSYGVSYDDAGRIVSRSESVNGLLVKQEDYLYENGVHMHTITTTCEYKSDGSLYCRDTYHDNVLFDKLYLTDDGGMILYKYIDGTVTYFDPAGNIIKTEPIVD